MTIPRPATASFAVLAHRNLRVQANRDPQNSSKRRGNQGKDRVSEFCDTMPGKTIGRGPALAEHLRPGKSSPLTLNPEASFKGDL